ncbi:MAG: aspartate--tRNA(Asn) ligase [Candidatus Thermoplasmatota archaeon]
MIRTHYSKAITKKDYNTVVTVAGWVEEVRNLGSIAFVILRDRFGTLQLTVLKKQTPELFTQLVGLSRESVIRVQGLCKENEKVRNGYEILPDHLEILSVAETPLPLGVVDKVEADFDTRLDNRVLDLRKPEIQAIFTIRSEILSAAHSFLHAHDFLEVHTPKIIGSSSEGGTDMFSVRYFEKNAFLAQSPQLYKQALMATGFDRVYEIAWYFRAEEHNTRRHLNESTAVDIEMAYIENEEEVMGILERLVQAMWQRAHECTRELDVLRKKLTVPEIPFRRIRYDDAVDQLQTHHSPIVWGNDLTTEDEKLLGELMQKEGTDFYFITRYPLECKPFYTMPEGKKHSRGFDLECKGVELASGSQRIHTLQLLEERICAKGLNPDDFSAYLQSFRFGMPPHGGFGFGIERFLMELLDIKNIRECILFPRDRTRITP